MKKNLKIALFIFIGVSIVYGLTMETEKEEVKDVVVLKDWKEMSSPEKTTAINGLYNGEEEIYSTQRFRLREATIAAIQSQIKYPETLEFKDIFNSKDWVNKESSSALIIGKSTFFIKNIDEGLISLEVPFRSENRIGTKVRSIFNLEIKYDGKSFSVKTLNFS